MTQVEIAALLKTTQKVVWRFMKNHGIESRGFGKRNQAGDTNANWKGDSAGIAAFHKRLVALFGRPRRCDVCKTTDRRKHYDWANLTGRYKDPDDYKRMCRSCHWKYDSKIENITRGKRGRKK